MSDDIAALLEDARIIVLEPDDILVVEFPGRLSNDEAARVVAVVESYTERRVLVLDSDARLRALREADA